MFVVQLEGENTIKQVYLGIEEVVKKGETIKKYIKSVVKKCEEYESELDLMEDLVLYVETMQGMGVVKPHHKAIFNYYKALKRNPSIENAVKTEKDVLFPDNIDYVDEFGNINYELCLRGSEKEIDSYFAIKSEFTKLGVNRLTHDIRVKVSKKVGIAESTVHKNLSYFRKDIGYCKALINLYLKVNPFNVEIKSVDELALEVLHVLPRKVADNYVNMKEELAKGFNHIEASKRILERNISNKNISVSSLQNYAEAHKEIREDYFRVVGLIDFCKKALVAYKKFINEKYGDKGYYGELKSIFEEMQSKIKNLEDSLKEKDKLLAEKDKELKEKDILLEEKDKAVSVLSEQLEGVNMFIFNVR